MQVAASAAAVRGRGQRGGRLLPDRLRGSARLWGHAHGGAVRGRHRHPRHRCGRSWGSREQAVHGGLMVPAAWSLRLLRARRPPRAHQPPPPPSCNAHPLSSPLPQRRTAVSLWSCMWPSGSTAPSTPSSRRSQRASSCFVEARRCRCGRMTCSCCDAGIADRAAGCLLEGRRGCGLQRGQQQQQHGRIACSFFAPPCPTLLSWVSFLLPSPSALQLFSATELERLVCGNPILDFDSLQKHARYEGGYSPGELAGGTGVEGLGHCRPGPGRAACPAQATLRQPCAQGAPLTGGTCVSSVRLL